MEKAKVEELRQLRLAKKSLPGGTLENYAAQVKAKVITFEEENKFDGLTEQEVREATALMVKTGEIEDPNLKQMA